jgi:hypothetical protein
VKVSSPVTAGQDATVTTSGSGSATLYINGPGAAIKQKVTLGEPVKITGDELRAAGRYVAIIKGDGDSSTTFFVEPAQAQKLNFLARPSRVPVSQQDVISGVVFVFDDYRNLVTEPSTVKFSLKVPNGPGMEKVITSKDGIAFMRSNSAPKAGAAQFVASVGDAQVRRVVQQVASDPCSLRMHAQRQGNKLVVETDPIRDCSGNAVPDGTIVTFIETSAQGRSTVDARIKRGIAKATLPAEQGATISVAAGVVLGNEVRVGGGE